MLPCLCGIQPQQLCCHDVFLKASEWKPRRDPAELSVCFWSSFLPGRVNAIIARLVASCSDS